ncbi:MAG: type II toxin-antitoxin system HicB family antitoxin [Patescibacteria group bacterium]
MRLSSYYRVEIEPSEEGGFVAHIPTLGCATQGETYQQVVAMAEECIRSALLGYLRRVLSILSKPSPGDANLLLLSLIQPNKALLLLHFWGS